MEWFLERGKEASTWLGLGSITLGVGQIVNYEPAGDIANIVAGVGGNLSVETLVMAAVGVVSVVLKDRGGK